MRFNLPVTDKEHLVAPGTSIVSKTDLRGQIIYANDAFVEISGYTRDELIGQPHNILRHPDMPAQAFAHLWETLKKGNPWKGIVKNRTKDGGFYWVKAVIVPVRKEDQTIGYMSVREPAARDEIEQAEAFYAELRSSGSSIRENPLRSLMTIRTGFFLGVLFVILLMIAGGVLGIGGLVFSNSTVETLHLSRITPMAKSSELDSELQRLRGKLISGGEHHVLGDALQTYGERMERLLNDLDAIPLEDDEAELRSALVRAYRELQEQARARLRSNAATASIPDMGALGWHFEQLHERIHDFQTAIYHASKKNYTGMQERNQLIWEIALIGLLGGILIVTIAGRYFLHDIVGPLQTAISSFDRIAQGNLNGDVEVNGKGETGQLIRASAVMQMHLKVITDEISLVAKGVREHCVLLNNTLSGISDHSQLQDDRLTEARKVLGDTRDYAEEVRRCTEQIKDALISPLADQGFRDRPEVYKLIDRIDNSLYLQMLALDDFQSRLNQLSDLVGDNRLDTQAAYAMSDLQQQEADRLYELVSYFSEKPYAELSESWAKT